MERNGEAGNLWQRKREIGERMLEFFCRRFSGSFLKISDAPPPRFPVSSSEEFLLCNSQHFLDRGDARQHFPGAVVTEGVHTLCARRSPDGRGVGSLHH